MMIDDNSWVKIYLRYFKSVTLLLCTHYSQYIKLLHVIITDIVVIRAHVSFN